jgi:hypothetical protein
VCQNGLGDGVIEDGKKERAGVNILRVNIEFCRRTLNMNGRCGKEHRV